VKWLTSTVLGLTGGYGTAKIYDALRSTTLQSSRLYDDAVFGSALGILIVNYISLGSDLYNGYTSNTEVKYFFHTKISDEIDTKNNTIIESNGIVKSTDIIDIVSKTVQVTIPTILYTVNYFERDDLITGTIVATILSGATQIIGDFFNVSQQLKLQLDEIEIIHNEIIDDNEMQIINILPINTIIIY
jgi:hypothetical protein